MIMWEVFWMPANILGLCGTQPRRPGLAPRSPHLNWNFFDRISNGERLP